MTSIVFSSPLIAILYAIAALFCIFDLIKRASGYVFSIISAVIFVGTTIYAFLLGAGYEEVGLVALIFLMLNLAVFFRHRGDKK